ncbi:MAG: noncanonical pyrimidine nucleotidase, YjjG family [Spirochaetia bacterium]|nr:noncanonical pyrimidine nucleotidase, YjjG family [Spirochaetia bacterium]
MYRYLFFDADGTLFDFERAEHQAFWSMAEALNLRLSFEHELLYKKCNLSCWKAFEQGVLTLERLKSKRFELFLQELSIQLDPAVASNLYQHHLSLQGILFDQSKEILQTLKNRGYVLYLASNGISSVQKSRIKIANIEHFFEKIYISEEIGFQKPDPRFFDAMFQAAGLEKQKNHCLMIGDSLSSDIKGGLSSGIDTLYLNLQNKTNDTAIVPTYTVTSLEAIIPLLINPN